MNDINFLIFHTKQTQKKAAQWKWNFISLYSITHTKLLLYFYTLQASFFLSFFYYFVIRFMFHNIFYVCKILSFNCIRFGRNAMINRYFFNYCTSDEIRWPQVFFVGKLNLFLASLLRTTAGNYWNNFSMFYFAYM